MTKSRKLTKNFISFYRRYTVIVLVFLLVGVLILGVCLRRYDYYTIPRHGATFDEFAWTWLGVNIINNGTPESWSSQPQYKQREHLIYQGAAFWIVKPYLEHPPLFGLVAGTFAKMRGVDTMYDVTLAKIRPLGLLMGTASILLVFLLTRSIYGLRPAYLAAIFYATVPTVVIGSRLVQNENFLIPMWLLALYSLHKYLNEKKVRYRNIAIVIVTLLPLAKVPWVVAGFSVILLLTLHKKWKEAVYTTVFMILFFSGFLLYGFLTDKELFLGLWGLQLARYDITYSGLFSIFTKPLLVDWYYLDGWIYFGWFAIFLLFQDLKKHAFIILPFLAYLLMYAFAIPDEPGHGWYRYPFYPFLIIATALFVHGQLIKPTLASVFFFFLTGFSMLQNGWNTLFGFSYPIYRSYILLTSIPVFFFIWFKKYEKYSKYFIFLMLIILLILNVLSVYTVVT